MSRHTPSPWRVVGRRILSQPVRHEWHNPDLHDARAPQVEVANFDYRNEFGGSYETFDRDTAQANARLIAAAPDLLATLKALTDTARTFRNVPKDQQEWTPIDDEVLNAAFAAIAKAEANG